MFAASKTAAQATAANYIEDVFSTYLYTGNGSTQTITNGIDLAGKGGLAWIKFRNPSADGITGEHCLFDTARGATYRLRTNATNPQGAVSTSLTSFNSDGFTLGAFDQVNSGYLSRQTYVSWTFRKQPKFFDVVTYTGNGSNRSISHSLGSTPGCVIVKSTSLSSDWAVWHRSLSGATSSPYAGYIVLNTTAAAVGPGVNDYFDGANMTSTTIGISTSGTVNSNGQTYVAYIFAHDAGGFGLTGTDNVISCGSFTTDASGNATVNLGYEPQWVTFKKSSNTGPWYMLDVMRQWAYSDQNYLTANTSNAESGVGAGAANYPTATGFNTTGAFTDASSTYIYIAIRRGPMKTPTSGTSVFSPLTNSNTTGTTNTTGFPIDLQINTLRGFTGNKFAYDRLRGISSTSTQDGALLITNTTDAESSPGATRNWDNTGFATASNVSGASTAYWNFRRAPGFFDEVCYTGTGANTTQTHNLGVAPELIIVKRRDTTGAWDTYSAALSNTEYLVVNTTAAKATGATRWNSTTPTSTVFSLGTSTTTNASGGTYVAYLFATVAGVSKVGSYTGTGTTKQIDCGFTGGARFVLIKRTDSTGDWYVWDSARGIVAGNDPYLLLNSTAAEVTSTDYVDTYSAGFEISSTAPAAINANGGTFIFLAIA